MIDTDKYEGHTEGLWEQYSLAAYHAVVLPSWKENIELILPKLADAKLIADAPLLLAEVKRLREKEDELRRDITMLENNLEHTRHLFGRSLERCTETKESLLAEIKRLSLTVEDTGVMWNE